MSAYDPLDDRLYKQASDAEKPRILKELTRMAERGWLAGPAGDEAAAARRPAHVRQGQVQNSTAEHK